MLKTFTKKQDHFNQLSFVAAAVGKDEIKPAMQHIYVSESGDVVATDGHRLHMYTPEELPLEPGYWSVNKCNKSELQLVLSSEDLPPHPDYKRAIPDQDDVKGFTRYNKPVKGTRAVPPEHKLAEILRTHQLGSFDFKYFTAALTADNDFMLFYKWTTSSGPLLLLGDKVKAVIMPIRI